MEVCMWPSPSHLSTRVAGKGFSESSNFATVRHLVGHAMFGCVRQSLVHDSQPAVGTTKRIKGSNIVGSFRGGKSNSC